MHFKKNQYRNYNLSLYCVNTHGYFSRQRSETKSVLVQCSINSSLTVLNGLSHWIPLILLSKSVLNSFCLSISIATVFIKPSISFLTDCGNNLITNLLPSVLKNLKHSPYEVKVILMSILSWSISAVLLSQWDKIWI